MKKLVTSALPYPNWPLHIWHVAWVHLPWDIFYRYLKIIWEDVFSICWTDDHWVGIEIAAKKAWITELELVQKNWEIIKDSLSKIDINYDLFSWTHSKIHMETSKEFFIDLLDKWFIEKKNEIMSFCCNCSNFLPDRYIEWICPKCNSSWARGDQCEKCWSVLLPTDLIEPVCKICGSSNIYEKETYNYFFKLSNFSDDLNLWLDSKRSFWKSNIFSSAKKWLNEWLEDRTISRDIKWGIPVPNDENKKMYVWFEAPIWYISFIKELSQKLYWNNSLFDEIWRKWSNSEIFHFIWKDNVVFHTIIWPALLLANGKLNLPTNVPWNDFLNLEWEKLSTSRNHAVWLHEIVEKFNTDSIRYYLTYCIPENKDSNFTWSEFKERNNELWNVLWNLLNRVQTFSKKNFDGMIDEPNFNSELYNKINNLVLKQADKVLQLLNNFSFKEALKEVFYIYHELNRFLHESEPWKVIKTDFKKAKEIIDITAVALIKSCVILEPFLPKTAKNILNSFWINNSSFFQVNNLYNFKYNFPLQIWEINILFKRLEDIDIWEEIEKFNKK